MSGRDQEAERVLAHAAAVVGSPHALVEVRDVDVDLAKERLVADRPLPVAGVPRRGASSECRRPVQREIVILRVQWSTANRPAGT